MQTAHLDRKLSGAAATNVLADGRWPMSQVKNTLNDRPTTFKRMTSTFSVSSSNNSKKKFDVAFRREQLTYFRTFHRCHR